MSSELTVWWSLLCAATAINLAAWGLAAQRLGRRRAQWPAEVHASRRRLLWLAAAYVLGCGFRSLLPMIELPGHCLHEVWLSRAAITRAAATVAELCFAAQWMLLLREAGVATGSRLAQRVGGLQLPIVGLAELSCWYAVLSANYLAHAIENALWTLAALLAVAALIALRRRIDAAGRGFLAAAIAAGAAYVAFMSLVDVPMYLARWQAAGPTRTLLDGWRAALQPCVVRGDWAAWREDALWLTLYFTVAVWISIALAHAPAWRPARRADP